MQKRVNRFLWSRWRGLRGSDLSAIWRGTLPHHGTLCLVATERSACVLHRARGIEHARVTGPASERRRPGQAREALKPWTAVACAARIGAGRRSIANLKGIANRNRVVSYRAARPGERRAPRKEASAKKAPRIVPAILPESVGVVKGPRPASEERRPRVFGASLSTGEGERGAVFMSPGYFPSLRPMS